MSVSLYDEVSKREIFLLRKTSEGKKYSLNHPSELVVNMRYLGNSKNNINSQGWERSSSYYFKSINNNHPEFFSKKNKMLIENGKAPVVDKVFTDSFPQFKEYKGETLVHHHIGQDGQAVALPQSVHKGFGEIHTVENELGITEKAKAFSASCDKLCQKTPSLYGSTSDMFKDNTKINTIAKSAHSTINSFKNATHTNNVQKKTANSITKTHSYNK